MVSVHQENGKHFSFVNILTENLRQDLTCDEEVTLRIIIRSVFQASETTWRRGTCVEMNKCNRRQQHQPRGASRPNDRVGNKVDSPEGLTSDNQLARSGNQLGQRIRKGMQEDWFYHENEVLLFKKLPFQLYNIPPKYHVVFPFTHLSLKGCERGESHESLTVFIRLESL